MGLLNKGLELRAQEKENALKIYEKPAAAIAAGGGLPMGSQLGCKIYLLMRLV